MSKGLIVQALCMVLCAGLLQICGAIELSILKATTTQLQVAYRLDAREQQPLTHGADSRITFSLASRTALHALAQVQPTRLTPAGIQRFSPQLQRVASGYAGMFFEQWFTLDPYHAQGCASEGVLTFTIGTQEAAGVYLTKSNVTGTTINIPTAAGLAKKASTTAFPSYPFTRGIRIEINTDGIYFITGRELAALGVPISTVNSKVYRLYENGNEIPLALTNSYRPHLQHDDTLFFFGEHLRAPESYFTQFSNSRMYWLCWEMAGVGARLAKASGARRVDGTIYRPGSDNPVTARDFMSVVHLEEDNDIRWLGDVFVPENIDDMPSTTPIIDNWYWGFVGYEVKTDFTLRLAAPSINPAARARLRIAMTGLSSIKDNPADHALTILLNNNSPTALSSNAAVMRWDGQTETIYETEWFPARYLVHGNNTLTFLRETAAIDLSALNWVQVEYLRSFRALDGVVDFQPHPEDTGRTIEFDLRGFTTPHVDIWDLSTARIIQDFAVEQTGKGDSVTISFQDSIGSTVHYWAQSSARRKTPHSLTLDTLAPRWSFGEGVDYVMVAPEDALDILKPLAEYYRSSGMTVALIDIADIYNGFAWGRRDPQAIRSLLAALAAAYPNRPPRYLLLGGDTSHDLDKQRRELNIIPTHLSRIPGWGPSSDDGYFGTVIGEDNFSDICVGRFPSRSLQELQQLVDKTLRYLKQPLSGYWRDNLLMLGGVEEEFSELNDQLTAHTIGSRMQVQRMDAYQGSPFFRDDYDATRSIADGINAGAYLVNFNGHGGGLTWSDRNFFSYTDLSLLYNGQWAEGGKLPFVFSFTCLTGFFESAFYRSLGEEMVRTPRHGAIGFYGASAYTPQRGNMLMNRLMLDKALHGGPTTIGELIKHCETEMLVRYGPDMLPLVRQYNLLGDPALPWRLAADTLKLWAQLNHQQDSLVIRGRCNPLSSGSVRVVVGDRSSIWYQHIVPLHSDSFTLAVAVKSAASVTSGYVRAYAWNTSQELKGSTYFSKNALAVHQPRLSQESVGSGDSVYISCTIGGIDSSGEQLSVVCLYETGLSGQSLSTPHSAFMRFEPATNRWISTTALAIGSTVSLNHYLKVKFRALSQSRSMESALFEFALQGKADLLFTSDSLQIVTIGDSLFGQLGILNAGNLSTPSFSTTLSYRNGADTLAHYSMTVTQPLAPAAIATVRFPLPQLSAQMQVFAHCDPFNTLPEANDNNNTLTLPLNLGFATLHHPSDTLATAHTSFAAHPQAPLVKPLNAYCFVKPLSDQPPLKTPSRFLPLRHDSTAALRLALNATTSTDSLQCFFALNDTTHSSITIARYDSTLRRWRWHTNAVSTGMGRYTFSIATNNALYAPALFEDQQPPQIRASVDGREMRFVDYAALNKPFTIFISDPSGIDPSTITVQLNHQALDSTLFSLTSIDSTLSGIVLTAYPRQHRSVDTLTIQAMDLAGNRIEKSIAYRPGERLAIKFLACHPNPFTARQDKGGSVVQPIRLAFLLTDVATHATLSIRTLSGRLVRKWDFVDLIGYQEISWDGLTQQGFRIGNGTYYVKFEAKNEYEKTSKIIRIAKLEGY